MYKNFFKRLLDIILSTLGLLFLLPFFVIISIMIRCSSRGPVLFKQVRVGKNKKNFKMLKFRTMRINAPKDCPTHLLKDANIYITKIGKILRKTSLDELPQIINIFTGKMSVIGPRPALYNQSDLIAERDKYNANDIRPGLTGWAQINGRDELPISDKAKLDGYYVQNIGFKMDIKCFFGTIAKVLKHDGVVEGASKVNGEEIEDNRSNVDEDVKNNSENTCKEVSSSMNDEQIGNNGTNTSMDNLADKYIIDVETSINNVDKENEKKDYGGK